MIINTLRVEYKKVNYLNIKLTYICKEVKSWFAAKTKIKREFKALDIFKKIGVKSYVPYYKTKRIWSDRKK